MIFTSAYGGNLRAFLMTPQYEKAIDTMHDIVNSKLPWTMILYGEEVEAHLMTSKNPIEKAFWNGKTAVGYEPFSYSLKGVLERKQILIQWFAESEVMLKKYLRRQNGEYIVHRSKYPLSPVQSGNNVNVVMMNKINPWNERFSHYFIHVITCIMNLACLKYGVPRTLNSTMSSTTTKALLQILDVIPNYW